MVAGGGYFRTNTYKANGGNGGGTAGTSGSYSNSTYSAYVGGGASQTTGGTRGNGSSSNYYGKAGTFGTGGDTGYKYNSTSYYSNGAGGGGWYGGGAAGNYSGASTARLAGGGGGSGFVWSTGKTRPDGYLVDEKYYLEDAATYSATETGFVTNPVTTGNGYLRITLIETKTTAEATATRWKNIEYQTEQGTFTGNFDYNGKTITEIDTENNTIIHQKINEIQYIEATGTQWIDTNICPTSNTKVMLKFNMTAPTGNVIIGFYNSESDSFRFFNYNNNAYLDYGSGDGYNRINGGTIAAGTTYNIEFGNRYVKDIDTNTNIISSTAVSFTDKTTSMRIFGDAGSDKASGKLYYCKVYDNNNLVGDFVPALDENNVPCLYDKVSNQYFYNSGTGTFNYAN